MKEQKILKVSIDSAKCDFSSGCPARRACPEGAIQKGEVSYTIDPERCSACGSCIYACPQRAISFSQGML